MTSKAEIERMEKHIAKVASVGEKWEKAVNKLRQRFPDDTMAVYKRLKVMVNESKETKKRSNSAAAAAASLSTSTSASTSASSKPSRKEIKRPPSPATKQRDIRDAMLTLPVKKKALADLSDEMTKDPLPELKATSSTIKSHTSGDSGEEEKRFSLRDDEHISLDGYDLPRDWTLPDNLLSMYADIDAAQDQEKDKEPEQAKKGEFSLDMQNKASIAKIGQATGTDMVDGNNTMLPVDTEDSTTNMKRAGNDSIAAGKTIESSSGIDPAGDTSMTPINVKIIEKRTIPSIEVTLAAKDSTSAGDTATQTAETKTSFNNSAEAGDTKMEVDDKADAKQAEDTTMLTTEEANASTEAAPELGDINIKPTYMDDHTDNKTTEKSESDLIQAARKSVKAEHSDNTQLLHNITDIPLSGLQIDNRILAHLASAGLTSVGYLVLKGIRKDDITPIIEAIAKAEGVGIIDGVLAARRIEEAYHAFQQQVFSQK